MTQNDNEKQAKKLQWPEVQHTSVHTDATSLDNVLVGHHLNYQTPSTAHTFVTDFEKVIL